MAKTVALILGLAMVVHLIRPLGLPGLKRRGDAWKIAALALFSMIVLVSVRPD